MKQVLVLALQFLFCGSKRWETFAFLRVFGNEASRQVEVQCLPLSWLDCSTVGVAFGELAAFGVSPALSACLLVIGSKDFE